MEETYSIICITAWKLHMNILLFTEFLLFTRLLRTLYFALIHRKFQCTIIYHYRAHKILSDGLQTTQKKFIQIILRMGLTPFASL